MGPFKKLPISKFAQSKKDLQGDDVKYWSQLKFPVTVQENSPINYIEIQPQAPHWVAVTGSSKVQLYNPQSNEVVKSFNKFKDGSFGASFRSDGKLLAAGTEEGTVRLFDVATKTLLRSFRGHSRATQRVQFVSDMKRVVSFSDDQVVKLWDTATEQCTLSFEEHKDYVRSGCVSRVSPSIFLSGSFDHTVKLWDDRKGKSVLTLNHGDPVEAILLFPNDGIVASAGGNDIKIWDVLAGGRLLSCLTPHNKTITSMGFCNQGHRFFSTSLDCHLKFHDLSKFQTVHSIKHVSPLLTAAISPDDSLVATGMSDGLVQFMHRKKADQTGENGDLVSGEAYPGHLKYLNFTKFQPGVGDVVVKKDVALKESKHDTFLRKFEFSKALDSVLKPLCSKKGFLSILTAF